MPLKNIYLSWFECICLMFISLRRLLLFSLCWDKAGAVVCSRFCFCPLVTVLQNLFIWCFLYCKILFLFSPSPHSFYHSISLSPISLSHPLPHYLSLSISLSLPRSPFLTLSLSISISICLPLSHYLSISSSLSISPALSLSHSLSLSISISLCGWQCMHAYGERCRQGC